VTTKNRSGLIARTKAILRPKDRAQDDREGLAFRQSGAVTDKTPRKPGPPGGLLRVSTQTETHFRTGYRSAVSFTKIP